MSMCKDSRKPSENKQKYTKTKQECIQGQINNIRNSVDDRQS